MRRRSLGDSLPRGFSFSAAACGLKRKGLDLGLIVSEEPASAACVFTTNRLQAAPVQVSRRHLRVSRGRIRAILVNSGNANCATGTEGIRAAAMTAAKLGSVLGCRPQHILACSTGVIGVPLRVEKITAAIPRLFGSLRKDAGAFEMFAHAIMTTDTRPKWTLDSFRSGPKEVRIAGCAKGAGMIHPQMATMLAFLVTDAQIKPALLRRALHEAVGRTFNRITVDGDTSTNDSVALLANGASGALAIPAKGREWKQFMRTLEEVCRQLARAIVTDGEGAQRVAEICVDGAPSDAAADCIARTIANSSLVKTALAGGDSNWGRILAAAGRAGVEFNPGRAEIWMAGIRMYGARSSRNSAPLPFDEQVAHRKLLAKFVPVRVNLHAGRGAARVWTCDLTTDYVRINAGYRT